MSQETNLESVLVYYSIRNVGDGSAYLRYFLNEEDAIEDQENMDEGWGNLVMVLLKLLLVLKLIIKLNNR